MNKKSDNKYLLIHFIPTYIFLVIIGFLAGFFTLKNVGVFWIYAVILIVPLGLLVMNVLFFLSKRNKKSNKTRATIIYYTMFIHIALLCVLAIFVITALQALSY
ncbi:MAG: hypothetical protein LBV51_05675 [Acholeplasmatales bacterium]|jgi:hypothetical protein|nr:hypothetical protein [Acholeplasmatales bacterium]